MTPPVAGTRPRRRTQAERRAATRTVLLDATVQCLEQEGYANLTTRRIAQRAGVTPGAQQHHFASKAELVSQALRHLAAGLAQGLIAQGSPSGGDTRKRAEKVIDRVWELHRGPHFRAIMELWMAARTDPELRQVIAELRQEVAVWNEMGSERLFPELAKSPQFAELVATGLAAMRGLAIVAFVNESEADERWPAMRAHLLELFFKAERRPLP
jgi:AcrR family transcriptional regulator